jgi:hypothetical protein
MYAIIVIYNQATIILKKNLYQLYRIFYCANQGELEPVGGDPIGCSENPSYLLYNSMTFYNINLLWRL